MNSKRSDFKERAFVLFLSESRILRTLPGTGELCEHPRLTLNEVFQVNASSSNNTFFFLNRGIKTTSSNERLSKKSNIRPFAPLSWEILFLKLSSDVADAAVSCTDAPSTKALILPPLGVLVAGDASRIALVQGHDPSPGTAHIHWLVHVPQGRATLKGWPDPESPVGPCEWLQRSSSPFSAFLSPPSLTGALQVLPSNLLHVHLCS